MFIFFDCLYFLIGIFYFPLLFIRRKWHQGLLLRWGKALKGFDFSSEKRKNVWIHAVSVGEVNAVAPLIQKLLKDSNRINLFLTVTTQTGYELAQEKWKNFLPVIWAPLDFSFVVRVYLRKLRPDLYVIVETEIWPNLIRVLLKRNIPTVLINGRISNKAFPRYCFGRWFLKNAFKSIKCLCVQTRLDAKRFQFLGADPASVRVVGNLKFDQRGSARTITRESMGIRSDDLLWVAGSTHPKEDEIILRVYSSLKKEFPSLRLIMAPRHIENGEKLLKAVQSSELKGVLFSRISQNNCQDSDVFILDVIGQLNAVYSLADIVFVGKSLLKPGGGQNMIEPAFLAKAIVVGPFTQNFQDVVELFLAEQALLQLKNADELLFVMRQLLNDSLQRQQLGHRARLVTQKEQGATDKTFQMIQSFISH